MTGRRARSWKPWAFGGLALALGLAALAFGVRTPNGAADLADELSDRGVLVRVGDSDLDVLAPGATRIVPLSAAPDVARALAQTDPEVLGHALDAGGFHGLLVDGRVRGSVEHDASLEAHLHAYAYVPSLRGVYLAPAAALYLRAEHPEVRGPIGEAAARVARAIVAGQPPPRVTLFPEPLRRIGSVEVMVLLRRDGHPRLWRSARGSSIARALTTAAVVARQRWQEREQAMGGSLDRALPRMDVEVSLLLDDGSLGSRRPAFLDRVITPRHGVAYERTGAWRYLLPQATQRAGEGSAERAYAQLFEDSGLPPDSLQRADLRLYRLVMAQVGVSPAPRPTIRTPSHDGGVADDGLESGDRARATDAGTE
ncbi:MAG: hypothetical protein GW913_09030 [Myxococcales bacterium]|nr:hypothetical protein [Myxococcales bacterium]